MVPHLNVDPTFVFNNVNLNASHTFELIVKIRNIVKAADKVPEMASIGPNPLDHFVSTVGWINKVAFNTP